MLLPVGLENLPELVRLKADPRVFSTMLHGVRTPERTREELEDDVDFWQVRGYGTWAVHRTEDGEFLGLAGLMERPDGRGVGFYFRNVTEPILFGVKGTMRTLAPGRSTVNMIETRKREHSRKPDEQYDLIESCSPGPRRRSPRRSRRCADERPRPRAGSRGPRAFAPIRRRAPRHGRGRSPPPL